MNRPAPVETGTGQVVPGGRDQITAEHAANVLLRRAISPDFAASRGVRSVLTRDDLPDGSPAHWTAANGYLPGLLFPWHSPDGETVEHQLRPDVPVERNGDVMKYVFRKDAASVLTVGKVGTDHGPVLIVEGTCQTLAASAYAPDDVTVYGIAGCQSWMKRGVPSRDLAVVEDRDVFIALDADAATNLDVYTAGVQLREACIAQGATSVRFVRITGGRKSGLDDVLAAEKEERRSRYLQRLIEIAESRPKSDKPELPAAVKPKAKRRAESSSSAFFGETGGLLVEQLAEAILRDNPAALTAERKVAMFAKGVFHRDGSALAAAVAAVLRDDYRITHRANVEEFIEALLYARGVMLPDQASGPFLNVTNGMLDLRSGELHEHDAKYLSSTQFPVAWDPAATCPTYDAWIASAVGDQLDDLEESVSAVLDPSTTPTKAVFLFGPSRSGKSTMLRLLREIVGADNTSAVSLHTLVEDRFAAANVYGKALNVSADLKAAHVDDISVFKLMTGEDVIQANRKYGSQFAFTNRALFAFSANQLPTIGESSRAYSERMRPIEFPHSFAGREDDGLEERLRAELPGILVRWVAAWQRRKARGGYLPTNAIVREKFEQASDRVRQFVADACTVHPTETATLPKAQVTTKRDLHRAFLLWSDQQRGAALGEAKFIARLTTVPGVREVQAAPSRTRGVNVTVRPQGQWGQEDPRAECADSTHPAADVDLHSLQDHPKDDAPQTWAGWAESAHSAQPTSLIDAFLIEHADDAAVPVDVCPDCERPRELVPHSYFWRSCRHCTPATFERSAS